MKRASRRTRQLPRAGFAGWVARAALVPPAAFAVHQLRFLLAFGGRAKIELAITGHSYLHSLVPWLIALLSISAGLFLRALARALGGHAGQAKQGPLTAFLTLWLACTISLIAIYTAQELLEGAFLFGHVPGLAGAFGFGGWWAVPAAAGVGLVLASLYFSAGAVLDATARRAATTLVRLRRTEAPRLRPALIATALPAPLAGGWSLRGPPTR